MCAPPVTLRRDAWCRPMLWQDWCPYFSMPGCRTFCVSGFTPLISSRCPQSTAPIAIPQAALCGWARAAAQLPVLGAPGIPRAGYTKKKQNTRQGPVRLTTPEASSATGCTARMSPPCPSGTSASANGGSSARSRPQNTKRAGTDRNVPTNAKRNHRQKAGTADHVLVPDEPGCSGCLAARLLRTPARPAPPR